MRFIISFNGREVVVEADSGVDAVIKVIDILSYTKGNMEFQIEKLSNSPVYH